MGLIGNTIFKTGDRVRYRYVSNFLSLPIKELEKTTVPAIGTLGTVVHGNESPNPGLSIGWLIEVKWDRWPNEPKAPLFKSEGVGVYSFHELERVENDV